MKKILMVFAGAMSAMVATAETVEYWDPVGKVTNSVEAVVVAADTATLESGWYVVRGEVSRAQINVTGTEASPANLILADGAKLTARDSSDYHPGIKVASGAALNIYAQSVDADTMGQLSASGGHGGAGIGGAGEGGTCGTVNIYGGKLTAVGGDYAAGIGGGGKASKTGGTGGTISIYGGIVTANGENGGAAIGGGNRADGGVISIYGGEVIADNTKGDSEGAGIGGGYAGAGGMILIAGGKVTAVGGYKDDGGAGIGGGEKGSGGTIMITGGIVNATGTDYGAGIGGGDEGAGGDITISGGTVVAKAGKSSVWDIGSGDTGGSSGEFVVTGGSVLLANSMKCRDGYPTNGDGTQVYCTMVPGFEANAAVKIEGLPNYGTNDIFADASGNVYLYLPTGTYSFTANGEARSVTVVNAAKVFATYWDPVSGTEKSALCVAVGDSTVLEDGNWYVVNGRVERGSVAVNGKANLILADGCELTANGGDNQAGVAVLPGNSLSIYGQKAGAGKLTAVGTGGSAGIGGDFGSNCNCGTVIINGGVVTATGGSYGAGIGGGYGGAGGTVTINGGSVTATGGTSSAGIGGGGAYGAGGTVNIYGGEVTATGGENSFNGGSGAGIGGGNGGAGGTVNIYGGTVRATGKRDAAGIGGDGAGAGGTVNIYGGSVTATGGDYGGAGIGGGREGAGGMVMISGGQIDAKRGDSMAANIGRGHYGSSDGMVTISGGIFSWRPSDAWIADPETMSFASNPDATTAGVYPWVVVRTGARVTFGHPLEHMTAAWTSRDGSVTNAISGTTSFVVPKGENGVKVIFTPEERYELDKTEYVFVESITGDCTISAEDLPTATYLCAVITVSKHEHVLASWTSGDGSVTNAVAGATFDVLKGVPFKVMFRPENTSYVLEGPLVYESDGTSSDVLLTDDLVPVARMTSVEYVDADGSVKSRALGECVFVTDATSRLASGWYAVNGNISPGVIAVEGDVHLILMNGCELKTSGRDGQAAVYVEKGNSLTIYEQTGGVVGRLTATGGDGGAGIGGQNPNKAQNNGHCGSITINGGIVTAQGGLCDAGIGGAYKGSGGTVTINGGIVTAIGGHGAGGYPYWGAAGIGGGCSGSGGNVRITGGRLSAKGGVNASVIGAGWNGSSQGTVVISGGIFSWRPNDGWLADRETMSFIANSDPDTSGAYPWMFAVTGVRVTFCRPLEHTTAAWTSGDGSVTNAISGTTYFIAPKGEIGVKVIFTPEDRYGLDKTEYAFSEPINEDCTIPVEGLPTATYLYAVVTFGRPLDHMTALWTSGDGAVTNEISGTTSFEVLKGTPDVKVIFASKGCYEINKTEYAFAGSINENCTIPADGLPTAQFVWPEGYRQVEYIESTVGGGQYIDTGVKASSTLTATMDYMAFEHTGRVNLGTLGDDNADWRYFDYSGGPLFDCGSARAGSTSGNTLDLNVRYVVNVGTEGENIYLAVTNAETKAEVKSFKAARSGAPSAENVFIFGGNSGDSLVCTSMRLYSLTLRDFAVSTDKLRMTVAEFVPCVRTSDGAVGLYDIENGVFKENAGSGVFVLLEDYPTCEGGTIAKEEGGVWVVTPNEGIEAVTITGLSEGAKLVVKLNGYNVPSEAFMGWGEGGVFSLALNPEVVTPKIGELDAGEPFVVGEGEVTVTIKTIPGLKYSLIRGAELGKIDTTVVTTSAISAETTLKDSTLPAGNAFYRVGVER